MKKFLLLLILCLIKLNAYEYRIYLSKNGNDEIYYFDNTSGFLKVRYNNVLWNDSQFYNTLNSIRLSVSNDGYLYIRQEQLIQLFKQNNQFLNDFYTQQTQPILNFFYNDNIFTYINHIVYEDYEILYNYEGLAVASVVNGQWAGLYDNSTMGNSGNLYNFNGSLVYVDGRVPSFLQKLWVKLSEPLMKDFMDANSGLIPLRWIVAFIIIFMLVYFCIRLCKNALGVEKWKI